MATFRYWDVRGLAEPIHLLLSYLKVPYTEKFFPNLPFFIDGDVKIVQSTNIQSRQIKIIEMIGVINLFRIQIIRLFFNPDFKKLRENYFASNISGLIKKTVDFLGQKQFLLDSLTYANFIFYDTIILLFYLYPQSKCQALIDQAKRFENIDEIKQYAEIPHSQDKVFFYKIYASWSGPNSD
ncbi:hypothetical protein ABPG72_013476 [Tetrahymena utriculariae]